MSSRGGRALDTPWYGAEPLRILPLPERVPQADGSYVEHWEMELERPSVIQSHSSGIA